MAHKEYTLSTPGKFFTENYRKTDQKFETRIWETHIHENSNDAVHSVHLSVKEDSEIQNHSQFGKNSRWQCGYCLSKWDGLHDSKKHQEWELLRQWSREEHRQETFSRGLHRPERTQVHGGRSYALCWMTSTLDISQTNPHLVEKRKYHRCSFHTSNLHDISQTVTGVTEEHWCTPTIIIQNSHHLHWLKSKKCIF